MQKWCDALFSPKIEGKEVYTVMKEMGTSSHTMTSVHDAPRPALQNILWEWPVVEKKDGCVRDFTGSTWETASHLHPSPRTWWPPAYTQQTTEHLTAILIHSCIGCAENLPLLVVDRHFDRFESLSATMTLITTMGPIPRQLRNSTRCKTQHDVNVSALLLRTMQQGLSPARLWRCHVPAWRLQRCPHWDPVPFCNESSRPKGPTVRLSLAFRYCLPLAPSSVWRQLTLTHDRRSCWAPVAGSQVLVSCLQCTSSRTVQEQGASWVAHISGCSKTSEIFKTNTGKWASPADLTNWGTANSPAWKAGCRV